MRFKDAVQFALDGKAVMFAGAGYSYGAINIKGKEFIRGSELANLFSQKCNLPSGTPLDDAAECFIEDYGEDELIKEIQNEFTVKKTAPFHADLASIPWKRIYTTNYDNVLESSWNNASKKLIPITLSTDIYKIPKRENLCIHLNGFINNLDRDTIHSELKLTESSYLTASLVDSEWMMMFRRDVKYAKAIFFLGYSLYDFDIKKILFDSEDLKEKSFFVIGQNPDVITERRASRFGNPIKKNIDGFAKDVKKISQKYQTFPEKEPFFLSIEEYKAENDPVPIEDQDYLNLLLFGDFKRELVFESFRTNKRYLMQRDQTDEVFTHLDNGYNMILVSSELGNGKTLFIENLNNIALNKNYRVFNVKERNEESIIEFDNLMSIDGKVFITIDGYQDWLDEIQSFSINAPAQKYLLLTARNALNDVLHDDLINITGRDFIPEIQIDNLSDQEINWFIDGFNEYGIWGERASEGNHQKFTYLKFECQGQVHSILLKFLNSPNISRRLKRLYSNIKDHPAYYEIALSVFIFATINQSIDIDTIIDLWGVEIMGKIRSDRQSPLREIINFERNYITVKSSVVGEYFLKNIADAAMIIRVLLKLTERVHRLSKDSVKYYSIFKKFMRFNSIQQILPEKGRNAAIMKYYESIKVLSSCQTHPLFWLQYAIACIVIKDLYRAEKYFESAYSYAEKRSWDTFQIDNHFARYLLLVAIEDIDDAKEAMENFRRAKNIIHRQMANERLHYPYKVAALYQPFYEKFLPSLPDYEIEAIKSAAQTILSRINALPENKMRGKNTRECKLAVQNILSL